MKAFITTRRLLLLMSAVIFITAAAVLLRPLTVKAAAYNPDDVNCELDENGDLVYAEFVDGRKVTKGSAFPNGMTFHVQYDGLFTLIIYFDGKQVAKDDVRAIGKEDIPNKLGYTLYYDHVSKGSVYFTSAPPAAAPAASHTHTFAYRTITEPTEELDGSAGDVCTVCGYAENVVVIPAIEKILYDRYLQIDQAKSGQTITLRMGEWNSFSKAFMSRIASKPEVNFLIDFTYNHIRYEVSIPRGTAVDTSLEWYGPQKMMELYSTAEVR